MLYCIVVHISEAPRFASAFHVRVVRLFGCYFSSRIYFGSNIDERETAFLFLAIEFRTSLTLLPRAVELVIHLCLAALATTDGMSAFAARPSSICGPQQLLSSYRVYRRRPAHDVLLGGNS